MATHKSAVKRHSQILRREATNRRNRTRLRGQLKKLRSTAGTGDAGSAGKMLTETLSLIDRSIQKGILHRNAAARQKSRLTRLVNSLTK